MIGGCLAIIVVGVLVFVVAPATLVAIWMAEGRTILDEELARLDQNEPLTAADLEASYQIRGDGEDVTNLWINASSELADPAVQAQANALPIVGMAADSIPPPTDEWEKRDAARAFVLNNQASLDQLFRAADAGGNARYPTQFSDGLAMIMNEVQDLRAAARALVLAAHVRAHDGDGPGALQALQTNLRLARSLHGYPVIIAQLVRSAIAGMTYSTLADLLPYLQVDDEELAELQLELARDNYDIALYDGLIGERAVGMAVLDDPQRLESELGQRGAGARQWMWWADRDKALYLSQMRRVIDASHEPWPDKLTTVNQVIEDYQSKVDQAGPLMRLQYMLSGLLLPALHSVFHASARSVATRDAAIVVVAIERYRRAEGELPASLDAIVPTYLDSIPIDPFDGEPLRYSQHRLYIIEA